MDPQRHRIQEDLRGLIAGPVLCDEVTIQQYASDASIFEVRPLGVVRPRDHDDVVAVVQYARENQLPLIARGAGSGLAGESLGHGLIVDFSHSMDRVIAVGRDSVTAQPGLVLARLNAALSRFQRSFGPDPVNRSFGTVGGAISRDAAGSRWHDYGSCGDQVLALRLVLSDGTSIRIGETATDPAAESRSAKLLLQSGVATCLERYQPLLRQNASEVTSSQRPRSDGPPADPPARAAEAWPAFRTQPAAYRLQQVPLQGDIDLLPLLIGSEGTLALITEATLRTHPIPNRRGVALLFFSRITDAARVSCKLLELPIRACDLVDRRLLSLAREADPSYGELIPPGAEAMLLVEAKDDGESRLLVTLQQIVSLAEDHVGQSLPHYLTTDPRQRNWCWHLVRRIIPTLYRLRGSTRAIPFVEDILIPPAELDQFLVTAQERLNQARLTASIFAHAAQGRLHLRPLIDLSQPEHLSRLERFAEDLYQQVWAIGGTIGTHGGLGLSRTPFLRRQAGALYPAIAEIKRIFDPHFVFNPGKIVRSGFETYFNQIRAVSLNVTASGSKVESTADADSGVARTGARSATAANGASESAGTSLSDAVPVGTLLQLKVLEPELNWNVETLMQATRNCNGCGQCRTQGQLERMCPMFRSTQSEAASPRAKANLLRAVLTGQMDPGKLSIDEMKEVTDTCFNCHQCRLDCPAGVDIPKIVNEMRAHYVSNNGLKLTERLLCRLDWIFRLANLSPAATHFLFRQTWSRWLMGRLLGVAPGRKLPRFHGRTFLSWARRRRLNRRPDREGPWVVLFVDAFVNWNDPELGRALVAVLEHNGIAVSVPLNQRMSGLSLISAGAIAAARKIATANVAILAEAIRGGAEVITVEPAATLALKHEYLHILGDPDARLVANHTREATEYLWSLHQEKGLRTEFRPTPVSLAHHLPCHQRATVSGNPGANLLRLIPELQVSMIDKGCSGMAGMYGVFQKNFRSSLRIGTDLIREVRQPRYDAGTTECSSCRIQMEQGGEKPTIHPLKILARAYGLLPELEDLFQRPLSRRLLS